MDNRLKFLYFFVPIESFKGGQNGNIQLGMTVDGRGWKIVVEDGG